MEDHPSRKRKRNITTDQKCQWIKFHYIQEGSEKKVYDGSDNMEV